MIVYWLIEWLVGLLKGVLGVLPTPNLADVLGGFASAAADLEAAIAPMSILLPFSEINAGLVLYGLAWAIWITVQVIRAVLWVVGR